MKRQVFAFKAKNDKLIESSSGGAFFAIAEAFFSYVPGKKVVYGAAYDSECNISTYSAYSIEECGKFRGSKYAECTYADSLSEVADKLSQGYTVLYAGIPCQISALKFFLSRHEIDVSNLYLVDIICHGIPQKRLWEDYKSKLETRYGRKLKQIHFRYKKTNYAEPIMAAEFTDGKLIKETMLIRSYMTLYFTYLPLKKACYSCKFSNMLRVSDVTLGDFWGVEKIMPKIPSKGGVSEIIVNTEKGAHLVGLLNKIPCSVFDRCESNDYIKYQHNLNLPTERPNNTEKFWSDYEEHGFDYILSEYADVNIKGKVVFQIKKALRYLGVYSKIQQMLKRG